MRIFFVTEQNQNSCNKNQIQTLFMYNIWRNFIKNSLIKCHKNVHFNAIYRNFVHMFPFEPHQLVRIGSKYTNKKNQEYLIYLQMEIGLLMNRNHF